MLSWSLDSDKLLDDQSNIIRRPRPLSFVLLFALITSNCWAPLWVNDAWKRSSGCFVLYCGTMRRLAIYSHVILALGDATVGAMDDMLP